MDRAELRGAVRIGAGCLAILVFLEILYPAPSAILFLGLVLGSLSALVAMGLVLIYRANRIVNFAQGDMGAVASVLAASLYVGPKLPFFLCVAIGLAAAVATGFLVEVGLIRRFKNAPRLVLTVATIGISQLLAATQLALPQLFDFDTAPQPPVPFDFTFKWFPVIFRGGHLLIVIVVPIVAIGLVLFFRRSRVGIAIRASAESASRAALLGIPVKRINTLVWVLAAGMSGVGVLLRLPIQGVQIGSTLGPTLMLRALAAAVIGRMESLPRTMAAAIGIGVIEQAVLYQTGRTLVVDGVLFGVIIVALLIQRQGDTSRSRDAGVESWGATREVRPIPRELMKVPVVRIGLVVLSALGAACLVLVPLGWSGSQMGLFNVGIIMAVLIASLVLLTGWAGQISLGHLAIMAWGASVSGSLAQQGKDFFVCLAAGAITGALVSLALGIPALRIRGPFFAVTTLAFATATGTFFLNEEFFPWLVPDGSLRVIRPVLFRKFDLESEHTYYFVLLIAFALTAAIIWRIRNSRTGRALVGNRDNTRAAQSYGVSPTKIQLTAFGISGLMAGLAGALYMYSQHGFAQGASILNPDNSIKLFAMGVIGGLSSIVGAAIGAAYLTFVDYSSFTREALSRFLASGIGVLIILLVFPAGLGGVVYSLRDRVLRTIARAKGIVVPSLLADVRIEDVTDAEAMPVIGDAEVVHERKSRPSSDPLLLVCDLELSYGKTQVLFGVDFHVERGEIVALLGTNGAGKSTLLNAISGLSKPSKGSVVYDGHDITGNGPNAVVNDGIVLMPGGKGVFPSLTVAENIGLAGWMFKKEQAYVKQATEEALEMFPILRERWDVKAGNLSGGQQQMLTLAQAFIARPKLLMIDELSLGLAPVIVQQLLEIVQRIHDNGTTIVVVEQSVNVAITLADRAVFLEKGEVRFDGPTADLLDRPEILRAVFLEGAAARDADVAERQGSGFIHACDQCGREHPTMLELDKISVRFGGVQAVKDVSFSVAEGEIVGIIGPNGAGKTTVLDIISGFNAGAEGKVLIRGTDVSDLPPFERAMLGLGRSFQDARLFPSMTVRQTIATALERHIPVKDPISPLVLSPAVSTSERWIDEHVTRLIDLMRLGAYADKFVGELSTGTRRIVDLACSLAHDPDVLLLDEPSSGIAQRETEALGPVLLDIRDQTGAALIVIEHDMPLITGISDRLVALELGAVVAIGTPQEVVTNERVVEGYLGSNEATIMRSGSGTSKAEEKAKPRRTRVKAADR